MWNVALKEMMFKQWKRSRFLHSLILQPGDPVTFMCLAVMNFPLEVKNRSCAPVSPLSVSPRNYCLHVCEQIGWHLLQCKVKWYLTVGNERVTVFKETSCLGSHYITFHDLSELLLLKIEIWCQCGFFWTGCFRCFLIIISCDENMTDIFWHWVPSMGIWFG